MNIALRSLTQILNLPGRRWQAQCLGFIIFLVFCLRSSVLLSYPAGTWNAYSVNFPLLKKHKLYWYTRFETRFSEDITYFYRYQVYLGPEYTPLRYLYLSLKYGFIEESFNNKPFQTENRLMLYITPQCKLADLDVNIWGLGKLKFEVENRFDFRIRAYKTDPYSWRYRVYPKISYPFHISKNLTLSPVVKQAFYFKLREGGFFSQGRTYGGVSAKIYRRLNVTLYYMRLIERPSPRGHWAGLNIIGTSIGYKF